MAMAMALCHMDETLSSQLPPCYREDSDDLPRVYIPDPEIRSKADKVHLRHDD